MALKGDLASVGLADVFQMLAHNQKVGILSIHGQDAWCALYFDRRGVTLYYNEHCFLDRLLDALVRRNYVAADLLDSLRRQNAGEPIGTVESLLSGGLIQEELFLESFRTQMEEEIYDLFLWEKVHWEFLEGESAVDGQDGVVNENFFFGADSLIMEAARRLDEWVFIREQVSGPFEVFETLPGYAAHEVVGLDELTLSILDLVDGKRSVSRITEISQVTAFQAHKALSTLRQKGFIQPLPEHKLIANANECIAEARLDDGIRLLERAVEVGAGIPDANLLAAKTYEMQAEAAHAAWHYKCYATHKTDMGEVDEGVAVLEHTIGLLPTDLEAWERLVHGLMLQSTPKLDPHAVGKDLIDLYLELDETDRARKLLEDLLKARPHDIELKKALISVHTKAGDTRKVMELYESIADDLVTQKDPIGAIRYLQKILMIDRNRREISDRIKQLYVLDEKHRSRRRSLTLVMAGLLCTATLGTIYYLYERNVRQAYRSLDAEPFLKEKDFTGAIAMYEDFLARYPLSFIESDVKHDVDRIRGMQRLADARREAARRAAAREARKKRDRYRALWKEYGEIELDMSLALARLEEIHKLAGEANEPVDRKFLADNKIELAIRTTRDYLTKASGLERKVEEAFGRGSYEEARREALDLHRKFPYTPSAARCLVPYRIVTEPPGARISVAGGPWQGASGEAAATPAWIRLPYDKAVRVQLSRGGFEDLFLRLKGADRSPFSLILRVEPDSVLGLPAEPVTGVGVGEALGLVGLRGGKLACIDLASGRNAYVKRLRGLDEVLRTPVVLDHIGVFATTHSWLYGIRLSDGEEIWRTRVADGIGTSLVPVPGGIVLGNGKGDLLYFGGEDGDLYWSYPTQTPPDSDPVWDGDRLWYASHDGLLLALDIRDVSEAILKKRVASGIVGVPLRVGKHIAVMGFDGQIACYEVKKKSPEVWRMRFDEDGTRGYMLRDKSGILVVTPDGYVRRLDPRSKKHLVKSARLVYGLAGRPLRTDDALYFVGQGEKGSIHITSLDAHDLSTRWDYVLEGGIRGRPTLKGRKLFVVGADGKIHVLE